MSLTVRLRLELADVPGALAEAAAIIADHGGNITAIDVQHGEDASAIDEVTVEIADANELAKLRRRLGETGVARVVALQSANAEDLVVRVLRRVTKALASPADDADVDLRRGVAELCATPAVWVSGPEEAAAFDVGRQALDACGEAVLAQTSERLPALAATVTGVAWLLAAAVPGATGVERVVFVARPNTKPFTSTEVARVDVLISLYSRIQALRSAECRPS